MVDLATTMALVRGLHLAATLSLLGTVGFLLWMLPSGPAVPRALHRWLTRLWWVSGLIALLAGVAWFVLQSAAIAGAETWSDLRDALPVVALHTRYGNTMLVRLGLVLAATLLAVPSGRWTTWVRYLAVALTAAALGVQGMIGHAGATEGAVGDGLVFSESLHLLAAGIWLGALLPLWLGLRALSPEQASAVCERFTPIGLACVLVLAGTGFAQGFELIGSVPALFGTPYGHFAMLKITLFVFALMLATLNRLWFSDRVAADVPGARRHLGMSICLETCLGLAIVTAAAFMASSSPAAHTTPVWPFPRRLSLVAVNEDPDFHREFVVSLIVIGVAAALMAAALLLRRLRWEALAILLLTVLVRTPSLSLLLIEAYPTSFQTSPTDFSAASIARGQALFAQNCAACHGPSGAGNGPAASGLHIQPADLTQPHIWMHSDGEMFWWLSHGIEDPEGGLAMPGFAGTLSPDDLWALIDYVRAHESALAMQQRSTFDVPLRAPSFPIACAGLTATRMADLRGRDVHVVTGGVVSEDIPPASGVTAVTLNLRDGVAPAPGSCVAATAAAWPAYAILTDLPPDKLAGAEYLVDPNGWLRAVHRPGAADGWQTREKLFAAIRAIDAKPIQPPSGGSHEHHH
ncbi:CopD family protein [Acidisphaera sp. S103]|uniref:CopD family protein n=1 Tax=Acidisphaera sp. S103 TaxID=1747223 RepID=UPI00131E9F1D|nr:CopD family protein [Acidisphaera sp. S103]